MKIMILNASPQKDWNTAQLLKLAQSGAESVRAETEYIDLYDPNFTGCHSCLYTILRTVIGLVARTFIITLSTSVL